ARPRDLPAHRGSAWRRDHAAVVATGRDRVPHPAAAGRGHGRRGRGLIRLAGEERVGTAARSRWDRGTRQARRAAVVVLRAPDAGEPPAAEDGRIRARATIASRHAEVRSSAWSHGCRSRGRGPAPRAAPCCHCARIRARRADTITPRAPGPLRGAKSPRSADAVAQVRPPPALPRGPRAHPLVSLAVAAILGLLWLCLGGDPTPADGAADSEASASTSAATLSVESSTAAELTAGSAEPTVRAAVAGAGAGSATIRGRVLD